MIKRIIAIVGLPRSGTTLITSILGMHETAVACYEPWNQNSADAPSPEQTPEALLRHFAIDYSDSVDTLIVKETSVDFQALLWLRRFLEHNSASYTVHTGWILRSYRHNYLSLMDTGREQWGNTHFVVNQTSYDRYVNRVGRSTSALAALSLSYPGVVFSYENLASAPQDSCEAVCAALDLSFEPAMLDYADRLQTQHVRGDVGMATEPKPVSDAQVTSREAQWEDLKAQFADSDADAQRKKLDAFWEAVCQMPSLAGADRASALHDAGLVAAYPIHFSAVAGDLRRALKSREEWMQLVGEHRRIVQPKPIEEQARIVATQGFEWQQQWAKPSEISATEGSFREGYVYESLNCRQRAILSELWQDIHNRKRQPDELSLYAPEYLSSFADYLRQHFAQFHGSEYFDSPAQRARFPDVPGEDLTQLSFADESMDYALVNDVFEHMPDIGSALRELARILTPRGMLLSTFPFAFKEEYGVVRARLTEDGSIEHLLPPEYHGDPVDNQGVLVFRVPGWKILEECRAAGFKDASMVFLCKPSAGIISESIAGIFVLRASKN